MKYWRRALIAILAIVVVIGAIVSGSLTGLSNRYLDVNTGRIRRERIVLGVAVGETVTEPLRQPPMVVHV